MKFFDNFRRACYYGFMAHDTTAKQRVINEALSHGTTIDRATLLTIGKKYGIDNPYFLMTKKAARGLYDISEFANGSSVTMNKTENVFVPVAEQRTDSEIVRDQRKKFKTLDRMVDGVISGSVRSMIVSGPAGIGKTYTIESSLESASDEGRIRFTAIKGFVKATGLYKALWENREEGQVILLDDADSAFSDEVSLNLLKAALDSSKRRVISWRSEKVFVDDTGENIPSSFDFRGSVIFITNLNFEHMILQGSKLAVHFAALISRSFYIDLNMASQHEYMLRIFDVLENTDMAYTLGLNATHVSQIKNFIQTHGNRMRETSLRMVAKLAQIMSFTNGHEDFVNVAEQTCLKTRK